MICIQELDKQKQLMATNDRTNRLKSFVSSSTSSTKTSLHLHPPKSFALKQLQQSASQRSPT